MQPFLLRFAIPSDVPVVGGVDLGLPSFFFLLTLGFMLSTPILLKESNRSGVSAKSILDISLWGAAAVLFGGRLGHVLLTRPRYFLEYPDRIFDIWHGGLNLMGAAVAGALFLVLWLRRHPLKFWRVADIFAPALSFCLIFFGVGCLSAGCFYGKPIDYPWGMEWPWAVVFYGGQVPDILRGIGLHPTQLYLSMLHIVLFLFLSLMRRKIHFDGQVALIFALGFSLIGLLIEPFRFGFERALLPGGSFTVSQLLYGSILLLSLFFWRRLKAIPPIPRPRVGVADRPVSPAEAR